MAANSYQWSKEMWCTQNISYALDSGDLASEIRLLPQEFGKDLKANIQAIECQVANIEQMMQMIRPKDALQIEDANKRNYNNNKGYQGQSSGNPTYNPNNQNHPNFSYENPNNALLPPPKFSVTNEEIDAAKKASKNDDDISTLKLVVADMAKNHLSLQIQVSQIAQTVREMQKLGPFWTIQWWTQKVNVMQFTS